MSTLPIPTPDENDLLLPFEQQVLPAEYKSYYQTKRNNFFASIQRFPALWNYYVQLDKIWVYEIDLLKPSSPNRAFPILLYINAHAKVRITIELAFTGCIPEARSILRDAVEFVAHAHHMLKDPRLQTIWLNKNDDEKAFLKEFWLFQGDGFIRRSGRIVRCLVPAVRERISCKYNLDLRTLPYSGGRWSARDAIELHRGNGREEMGDVHFRHATDGFQNGGGTIQRL